MHRIIDEMRNLRLRHQGWRQDSAVGSTDCTCRGPGLNSQFPHGASQPSVTPTPGVRHSLPASVSTRHSCRQNTHYGAHRIFTDSDLEQTNFRIRYLSIAQVVSPTTDQVLIHLGLWGSLLMQTTSSPGPVGS